MNEHAVEYLLIGGYAVSYHGYPRATGDMDIWVAIGADNAARLVSVFRRFGFDLPGLSTDLFLKPNNIIRMGVVPFRIEVLTTIDGVAFSDCFAKKVRDEIDGVSVNIIDLSGLRQNKAAANRAKDQADLENLA